MIVLEQQTWVNLVGFAGFGLALLGYLRNMKQDLNAEISGSRAELKADIAGLRSELKADIREVRLDLKADIADLKADVGRLDSRLTTLENRTYDISARLPPAPAGASPS